MPLCVETQLEEGDPPAAPEISTYICVALAGTIRVTLFSVKENLCTISRGNIDEGCDEGDEEGCDVEERKKIIKTINVVIFIDKILKKICFITNRFVRLKKIKKN